MIFSAEYVIIPIMNIVSSEYAPFREKQSSIYDRFAATQKTLGKDAILSGNVTPQSAFLVAFRHPNSIAEPTESFSAAVHGALATPGSEVSSLVYDKASLHTTLSDFGLGEGLIDPDNPEDRKILDALALAVQRGLGDVGLRTILQRAVSFEKPLVNANSAIIAGDANDAVLDIIGAVRGASQNTLRGDGLKGSWGAHMTAARFHGTSTLPQAGMVAELAQSTKAIGKSAPTSVDVGWLEVNPKGFTYNVHESFPL